MTAGHMFDNATTPALKTHLRSQEAIRSSNHCRYATYGVLIHDLVPLPTDAKPLKITSCGCAFRTTVRNEESLRTTYFKPVLGTYLQSTIGPRFLQCLAERPTSYSKLTEHSLGTTLYLVARLGSIRLY